MPLHDLLATELRHLDEQGLRRRLRHVDSPQGPSLVLDGRTVHNFSSNNYLGLASSPELIDAARTALTEEGYGAGASRLIVGNLPSHRRLEHELAAFHVRPSALVFTSGYQANVGVLSALAGRDDAVFSDELNHASLIDGCRLSRARVVVYRHADPEDLDAKLRGSPARRRFVVTDSIFSMDGDLAPLAALREVADRHGASLVVDEAHATGVLGPNGRGLAALEGIEPDVHIATLSKALGAFGAYVTGPQVLTEYLLHRARSFVFTTALPPSVAAAGRAAILLSATYKGEALRTQLGERIQAFARGLSELGLLAPGAGGTPIFPVMVGDENRTMEVTAALLHRGLYAQGIRPPTVPRGTSRLRFALMATHTHAQINEALDALSALVRDGLIPQGTR